MSSEPITLQRIKKDLAKICDITIRDEKVLTHLYYKKYIAAIYIGYSLGSFNILDDENEYQKRIEKIEKGVKRNHLKHMEVYLRGVRSQEEIDELHKNNETSKKILPNLKTNVKKQKVPKGSLKYRVKINVYSRNKKEFEDTVEQFTNLFGEDKKSSSYVNMPSLKYRRNYIITPLAVYVNFDNEDDIVMLTPFNNHPCVKSMKLEIFNE